MAYDYQTQRPNLFTEEGSTLFLSIYEKARSRIRISGAVRMAELMQGHSGDSWDMLACADRLVELRKIREVTTGCAGQDRVFVAGSCFE